MFSAIFVGMALMPTVAVMAIFDGEEAAVIKPVSEENKKEWAELAVALWPDSGISEALQELADSKHQDEFLYYANEQAVALMSLSLRHDYVEGTESSPVGYLEGIYVKPEHRKKGIAKELVQFAKEWSKNHGCAELASDCELENEESRIFHEQIGFTEASRIICFTMSL